MKRFLSLPGVETRYAYKADVHDYFNSVPVDRLLPMLKAVIADDPPLLAFLTDLLTEPMVSDKGRAVPDSKGIMAGTPLSTFYANLYLSELDRRFSDRGVPYARYSDDIIVFGETEEETRAYASEIRAFLAERGLTVNPDKEDFFSPSDGWIFLGFSVKGKSVDIAPATIRKLKQKMKRKTNALKRWRDRNEVSGERAAAAFIRIFNKKLLEAPEDGELSWSRWFFPVISSDEGLHTVDRYAQQCLRYLISGKHNKGAFHVKYEDMKALGYRSLVNEFYKDEPSPRSEKENRRS